MNLAKCALMCGMVDGCFIANGCQCGIDIWDVGPVSLLASEFVWSHSRIHDPVVNRFEVAIGGNRKWTWLLVAAKLVDQCVGLYIVLEATV